MCRFLAWDLLKDVVSAGVEVFLALLGDSFYPSVTPSSVLCTNLKTARDELVKKAKHNALSMSAAVVFLPERTRDYGKCGTDKCYCVEMYGEKKPWGCRCDCSLSVLLHINLP